MIRLRPAAERGHTRLDWLDSRHSFSFDRYYDPAHMGFRALRVLNDDRVRAGAGFGMHGHRDMEIVSWVLSGALEHKDSLGSGSVLRPGEVQHMTAGRGIRHAEFNPSATEEARFVQIWVEPEAKGLAPSYGQKEVPAAERRARWRAIAAPGGRDGALAIRADAVVYATLLAPGERIEHRPSPGRGLWLQVTRGAVEAGGHRLEDGDGAAIEGEALLVVQALSDAEALLLDLA